MTDAMTRRVPTVLSAGMRLVALALTIGMMPARATAQPPSASPAPTPDIHYVPTSNGVPMQC